jgi:hypothetical protein
MDDVRTKIETVEEEITPVEDYESVFERYLEICNQAIEKNRNNFPYSEIWKARWKMLGKNNILQCAVYDDRPKIIYTLHMTEDMKINIVEKTYVAPDEVWPFKYTYLKHVVDNPAEYIEHPANLDWGWLADVFG